jgi:hypothetical protein
MAHSTKEKHSSLPSFYIAVMCIIMCHCVGCVRRFPYLDTQSHVPNTGYKKVPYPNVVNKGMPGDKIDR